MAGAVGTVAAYAVLLNEFFGNSVAVDVFGHGGVEGIVKDCNHGNTGVGGLSCLDTQNVGGVVQGCEGESSSILVMTSSVMTTGSEKMSPP